MYDELKYKDQIKAIGRIYRLISDVCKNVNLPDPEMRPMLTYTQSILKLHQNKASSEEIEKELSELSNEIEVSDWDGIVEKPIPMELRNYFWIGYYSKGKNKIMTVRKRKSLTQEQLAQLIGVTQKDVSRWEREVVVPKTSTLKKLSEALECKIDDLI